MRRPAFSVLLAGLRVLVLGLIAQPAGAQEAPAFRLGRWGGLLEVDYLRERQSTHSPDQTQEIDSLRRLTTEQLTLWNEGFYVYDPRLFTGKLQVTVGVARDRDVTNGQLSSSNSQLNGYAFDGFVLAEMPIRGRLFGNRTRQFLTQTFSHTDSQFENLGAEARLVEDNPLRKWDIRNLSSTLSAEQQKLRETTTSVLGQTYRRDEMQNILRWTGHNGFLQSDLDWRIEHDDFKDNLIDRGSFRSDSALVTYSVDFGPDRNRRSDSQLSYTSRSGSVPIRMLIADERVHIDHYTNLASDYRYQLQQLEVQSTRTTTQTGSVQMEHELFRNLTSTAMITASHVDLAAGTRDTYTGRLNFGYRRGLPWGGVVIVNASGREQLDENRLLASQVSVTEEAHSAPSPLGVGTGFDLNQAYAVADSIVVVDTRGGARLSTTLGTDYYVVQQGNRTTIVPLATSAVVQPGDPLVISYVYTVDPSIKYRTAAHAISAGLDFSWIAVSAGREQSGQTLLAGRDSGFLESTTKDTAQIDLRGRWTTMQGEVGAAYVRYDAPRLAYAQRRYRGSLAYRPMPSLTFVFAADQTLNDYTVPVEHTDLQSLRLTTNWYSAPGWSVSGLASRRIYKDTLQPTEVVDEANMKARFEYAKLSIQFGLTFADRSRGGFRSNTRRIDLSATRRL